MSAGRDRRRGARRDDGFALLVTLLVLVIGAATLFVSTRPAPGDRGGRDPRRSTTLAQARAAVVAYAQFDGEAGENKPGALPCPDTSDPTDPADADELGVAGATCQGAPDPVYLGRLPWRTIDLARRPAEGSSDIWYAIDGHYQDDPDDPGMLNAGAGAGLGVVGADPGAATAPRVAVLLLPGAPLAGQDARPETAPAAWLEGENADGDTVFRDCAEVDGCNDRVIGITVDTLFRGVQRRVLAGVGRALDNVHDRLGSLPWAAPFDSAGLGCESGRRRGRLPRAQGDCSGTDPWIRDADFEADDQWIVDNGWDEYVVYEVAAACAPDQSDCGNGDLVLDDDGGLDAVVAGAGRAHADQHRPGTVADFLDSAVNRDADGRYEAQAAGPADNDVFRGITVGP